MEERPEPLQGEPSADDAADVRVPEPAPVDAAAAVAVPGEPVPAPPVVAWRAPDLPRKRHVPGAPGLIYAGVLHRTVAWLVDLILIGIVSFAVLTVLIAIIVGTPDRGDAALSTIVWIGVAVIAAVYFIAFWTGPRRATLGMRVFRLQIGFVATGQPLSLRQAVVRVVVLGIPLWPLVAIPVINTVSLLAVVIWPIVLLVSTARNARRRGLHDRAAWSAVVMPAGTPRTT